MGGEDRAVILLIIVLHPVAAAVEAAAPAPSPVGTLGLCLGLCLCFLQLVRLLGVDERLLKLFNLHRQAVPSGCVECHSITQTSHILDDGPRKLLDWLVVQRRPPN